MLSARRRPKSRVLGPSAYTLVEVLVTLFISATALTAVLGLQISALYAAQQSQFRSQASFAAADMAERMRLNHPAVSTGAYLVTEVASVPDCQDSAPCTPMQMAAFDLWHWQQWLSVTLPRGSGTIEMPYPGYREILVHWDNNRDGDAEAFIRLLTAVAD